MRILLTGGTGRFGAAFQAECHGAGHQVVAPRKMGPDSMDLDKPATLTGVVERAKADWVVHAAALTDVDACEKDPATAQRRNAEAAGHIARAAAAAGSRLAVLSTDYVFDGAKGNYRETDTPAPTCAYGKSKLDGEAAATAAVPKALVCRTSMVFGARHKTDFVRHVRETARKGEPVRVVDQRGSPTHCADLARQVLALVEDGAHGIHNTAGATPASREEVARLVAPHARIEVVAPEALGWVAKRPADSSLDVRKVSRHAQPWSLKDALSRMDGA